MASAPSETSMDSLLATFLEEYSSVHQDASRRATSLLAGAQSRESSIGGDTLTLQEESVQPPEVTQTWPGDVSSSRHPKKLFGKLSNDVLALIFAFSVRRGKTTGNPGDPEDTVPEIEITISHVCGRWRRLALSLPSLWNFFRFDGQANEQGSIPEEMLEAYLERSKNNPFDVWLSLATDHSNREEQKSLAYRAFSDQAHRVRLCRLQTDDEGLNFELSQTSDAAPMLQALSMVRQDKSIYDYSDKPQSKWTPYIFTDGTPNLKYVHLDGASIGWFTPPLDSVVHLRLESKEEAPCANFTAAVLDYVLSLPHLESLSIRGIFFEVSTEGIGSKTIRSTSLKHFRCDVVDSDGRNTVLLEYFLSNVFAPPLQSITFEDTESRAEDGAWPQFEPERFPSLRILAFRRPGLDIDEMEPLLNNMPGVQHFIWSGGYDCVKDLVDMGESGLFPQLQQITIDGTVSHSAATRQRLVSAFPNLTTLKVRKKYADVLGSDEDSEDYTTGSDSDESRRIKVTTIQPTEFPSDGWIYDPRWIEVGDGAFSGWEYYNCLDLD